MEVWETIQGIGAKFDTFFEAIPKKDRKFLSECSNREYDGYMKEHYESVC